MLLKILLVFVALGAVNCDRRAEVRRFMERENFLKHCEAQDKSWDECVSLLKRYCGLQHVGGTQLTDELMSCVRRRKCGLPLINIKRTKAFYEETPKFDKKYLTYLLQNKAAKTELSMPEIEEMVKLSFDVWSCYTPLQFRRVTAIKDADIIIAFTPREHGYYGYFTKKFFPKGFPFDGPGGVLAHAFLPYKEAINKGNFHYDDEETWIENHKTGTKIFHTTVHELGHNLGLPHTTETGNIMYGGYDDSFHETELDLGPYDKYEIQKRYGSRQCTRKIWQEYYKNKYPDGDTTCDDKSDSCERHKYEVCLSDREWMRENCAAHCGFCGDCTDLSNQCSSYSKTRCYSGDTWFVRNCKAYCGFCAANEVERYDQSKLSPLPNRAKEEVCNASRIDGAYKTTRHDLFLVVNGTLYKKGGKKIQPMFRKRIGEYWDSRLTHPTAVAYSKPNDTLYLFQGRELFVVKESMPLNVQGSTVTVLRLPKVLRKSPAIAAFFGTFEGKDVINVYHNQTITSIVVQKKRIRVVARRPFSSIFDAVNYPERIPSSVDSAFDFGNKVYFMTGSSATIAFKKGDLYTLPNRGMKPFMTDVLRCPQVA